MERNTRVTHSIAGFALLCALILLSFNAGYANLTDMSQYPFCNFQVIPENAHSMPLTCEWAADPPH